MTGFIHSYGPWLWLGVLVACCAVEALSMSLTTIWAAIAALPLIFIARTGLAFKWQLLIFAALTVALIVFTRPFAVKKLGIGKDRTNVNSLIGQEVLVTKAVTAFQKGEAKAKNGVIWSAKAADGTEIPRNSVCTVSAVEGNTIIIEKISSEGEQK